MAGYSDDEIVLAVSQFVKSNVKVVRDALGPVDQGAKFDEVVQLISSTLIFDPNAIYYLIFLATNSLNHDVVSALEFVADMRTALTEVSKPTKYVSRTSLLADAAAALQSVDTILTQNSAISSSAFNKYVSAVDAFRDASLTPNIKEANQIVRPPQEARKVMQTDLSSITAAYPELLVRADLILTMLDQFEELDLPVKTIQSSIRQTRSDLVDLRTQFESTTVSKDDKIGLTRDAYLRITAGKAVLTSLANFRSPNSARITSTSTRKGYAASVGLSGELISAAVTGTKSAPWDISTGTNDTLIIAADGAAPTTYTIVPPVLASVTSFGSSSTYDIHVATYASVTGTVAGPSYVIPLANDFKVAVDSVTYSGTITTGTRTIAEVIADIRNLESPLGAKLSTVVSVTDAANYINLTHLTAGARLIMVLETDPENTPVTSVLGFLDNPYSSGLDANNIIEIDEESIVLTTGIRTPAQVASDINTWATANSKPYLATSGITAVTITKTAAGKQSITMTAEASSATVLECYKTLGFYEGQTDRTTAVSADELAYQLNQVDELTASVTRTFFESGTDGTLHSSSQLYVPHGVVASTNHVGDMLYIRSGANSGYYRIVSVTLGSPYDTITVSSGSFVAPFVGNQSWQILRELLTVTSKVADLSSRVQVNAASANSTIGLTVGTYYGTTTGFEIVDQGSAINLVQAFVVVGDKVQLVNGTEVTDCTVAAMDSDYQLELTPPIKLDGSIAYSFSIWSADVIAYEQFSTSMVSWKAALQTSLFSEDAGELVRAFNPVLYNKNPSQAQISDADSSASQLAGILSALSSILVAYVIRVIPRMDAALRMLLERGMDRAYDTLLGGNVIDFFSYDKDDVSSSAYMLKASRTVVQSDIPISKLETDGDDVIHDPTTIVTTDSNYDYSDMDKDENIALLGELPDVDQGDPNVTNDYYYKRY